MEIIREGRTTEGTEIFVPDEAPLPRAGELVVSARRWLETNDAEARVGVVGLRIDPDFDLESLAGKLAGARLIEIAFPTFADGRGYSFAQLLRRRHGYQGELRAVGDVLPDQLQYMQRCGFDSFALKPGKRISTAIAALTRISVRYQPAADDELARRQR